MTATGSDEAYIRWLSNLEYADRQKVDHLRETAARYEGMWADPTSLIGDHDTFNTLMADHGTGPSAAAKRVGIPSHATVLRWAKDRRPSDKLEPAFAHLVQWMASDLHAVAIANLLWHVWCLDHDLHPETTTKPNDDWMRWADDPDHIALGDLALAGLPIPDAPEYRPRPKKYDWQT